MDCIKKVTFRDYLRLTIFGNSYLIVFGYFYLIININNALKEEAELSTVAKFVTVQIEGTREVTRMVEYYDMDKIISAGYRVKSKQGIAFRRWASSILK